ncbi:hypothetical protein JB92DRAFT_1710502 [Gautieria morchelliformis]|nr:hypothetical protein JB92DRAFT_1710502 [Gautieria morchelliformis]
MTPGSQMENARANGRGEDIKRIKDLMQSLRSFHPALRANDKESRGFNHPQIGRLLVSAPKVRQWDEDEEFRRRVKKGIEIFRPQDFPVFLYEDDKVDPNNLLSGFLRSEILIRAYRAIMIGPSAIDGRGTSARATKKGNAQLNNMTDISIPSLSYIATLVCVPLVYQIYLMAICRYISAYPHNERSIPAAILDLTITPFIAQSWTYCAMSAWSSDAKPC